MAVAKNRERISSIFVIYEGATMGAGIHAIYIINKAGGLIYQKDFIQNASQLNSNDYLRLAGVFHGMHAIAKSVAPTKTSGGIVTLEAEHSQLRCYQSPTGTLSQAKIFRCTRVFIFLNANGWFSP